jgi:TRAP transporter TAXI family solute receptor
MVHPTESWLARHRLAVLLASVVAAAALLWWVLDFWRPLPSRSFVMASGAAGTAYETFGERYQAILARDGVTLELRPSAGAAEDLELLQDPRSGVMAAFLLGGTVPPGAEQDLVSLGATFYEPMWLFWRSDQPMGSIAKLKGRRISIGVPGSGSHEVARQLLRLNDIAPGDLELLELDPLESAGRLESGDLDAVFMTAAWQSPVVQRLLLAPGVRLEGFPRADAYVARYPFLTLLKLPMGVADLAANIPPGDVTLVAFKATLVARRDLHPALQYLLIHAALETHGRAGIFHRAGEFPSAEELDLPLSDEARHFYRSGPSFLQRHLPFWMAEILQRTLLVMIPLFGLLYPLWSGLPRLYHWEMQHRINRAYGELRRIEYELLQAPPGSEREAILHRLASVEQRVQEMRIPNAFAAMGYTLRMHIRMLRDTYGGGPPPP